MELLYLAHPKLVTHFVIQLTMKFFASTTFLKKIMKYYYKEKLKNYPINSKLIYMVTGNKWSNMKIFRVQDIIKKAVYIPYEDIFYFFPMIHSSN